MSLPGCTEARASFTDTGAVEERAGSWMSPGSWCTNKDGRVREEKVGQESSQRLSIVTVYNVLGLVRREVRMSGEEGLVQSDWIKGLNSPGTGSETCWGWNCGKMTDVQGQEV